MMEPFAGCIYGIHDTENSTNRKRRVWHVGDVELANRAGGLIGERTVQGCGLFQFAPWRGYSAAGMPYGVSTGIDFAGVAFHSRFRIRRAVDGLPAFVVIERTVFLMERQAGRQFAARFSLKKRCPRRAHRAIHCRIAVVSFGAQLREVCADGRVGISAFHFFITCIADRNPALRNT